MKYYSRETTSRKPINKFGRLGYVAVVEYVKTEDITPYNKGKRIHFLESKNAELFLMYRDADVVYSEDGEILSRHASKYRR